MTVKISKIQSIVFTLLMLFVTAVTAAGAEPLKPQSLADACASCHADFSSVLPRGHFEVKEPGLASCVGCHSLGQAGDAKKNAFSTRMHLAHADPKIHLECVVCHSYEAGKGFGLINQNFSWGAPKDADLAVMKKMLTSWLHSGNMDHLHAKAMVSCGGCHGKQAPLANSTVENNRCLGCHGPHAALAVKSKSKNFPERNPHESHLGSVACSVCHHAHTASRSYCLECHQDFEMPIPGGAKE